MPKYILFILFTKLCISAACAQTPTDSAALRALQVGYILPPERVYLHFDNTSYYLGETIWFKAFVTSNNDDRPTTLSRVLYVELVAPEGYVVKTNKYKIDDDGTCNGDIYMDPLYLSGYYEVRAYTRYMLNWGDEAIFSRVFPVFDKVNNGDWGFRNMRKRERCFMTGNGWTNNGKHECTLKFYPEGGHMVAGIEGRVAFELRGNDGIEGKSGIIILADNKMVLETFPQHMGKGSFTITPEKGVRYMAKVIIENAEGKKKEYRFNLPAVEDEGVSLSVTMANGKFNFAVNDNFTAEKELGFAIIYRSSLGFYKQFKSGTPASIRISADSLPEGVCRAIVFKGRTPLAERLFFVKHNSLQANDHRRVRLNVTANGVQLNKLELKPHEKITLDITRDDGKPLEMHNGLAISVTDRNGGVTTSWGYNMYTWQIFGSELKGYIPDAWQYFDPNNQKRDEHLDIIMMTHGWTAYDWSRLTAESLEKEVAPEKGITLRGQLFRRLIGHSWGSYGEMSIRFHKNRPIKLYVPEDSVIAQYDLRTDNKGCFIAELEDFYGKKIVALSPNKQITQTRWIRDAFMIDRYFSPEPHILSYWEVNAGSSLSNGRYYGNNIKQTGTNDFELPEFTHTRKLIKEAFERKPISELRLDYMDEWEYANDITFRYGIYDTANGGEGVGSNWGAEPRGTYLRKFNSFYSKDTESLFQYDIKKDHYFNCLPKDYNPAYYLFRDNLPQYTDVLTVSNVISSIFSRYNLSWCYWVMPAVIKGNYTSNTCPELDSEYIHGTNVEKMTNFSEIIISSNKEHCKMFEGGEMFWKRFARETNDGTHTHTEGPFWNKVPYSFFYDGFYKMKTIHATKDEIEVSDESSLEQNSANNMQRMTTDELQKKVKTPNFVAFLIPTTADSCNRIMKVDLSTSCGVRRYTSLQGYSRSKQFYSPDYSILQPDPKDCRRTLLWSTSQLPVGGKIRIELYNSQVCNAINVDITGFEKGTIYSNDKYFQTNRSLKQEKK